MVERSLSMREVPGSIPGFSILFFFFNLPVLPAAPAAFFYKKMVQLFFNYFSNHAVYI